MNDKYDSLQKMLDDLKENNKPQPPNPEYQTISTIDTTVTPTAQGIGNWVGTVEPYWGKETKDFINAITSSLEDNIEQNKGNLKMTRSFLEASIEAALLKTNIKLIKDKNINEVVEAVCNRLIAVDSPEINIPACMVNLKDLSERIHAEVEKYKEHESSQAYTGTVTPSMFKYITTIKEEDYL